MDERWRGPFEGDFIKGKGCRRREFLLFIRKILDTDILGLSKTPKKQRKEKWSFPWLMMREKTADGSMA